MRRKVTDLNKTAHKTKPVSKRRLQYLLHKAEVLSNKYKAERDILIDDIDWQQKKIERLERENEGLREQSDTYFEQWQQHKALNNEISQHIGNKPSSSTYKYFRAKLDGMGIKEGE